MSGAGLDSPAASAGSDVDGTFNNGIRAFAGYPAVIEWKPAVIEGSVDMCRPVMHLGGELDGQARFPRLAYPAMQSAACSSDFRQRSHLRPMNGVSLALTTRIL